VLYITIFIILFILGFLDLSDIPDIVRNVLFWFVIGFLFIISSLRWKTGTDWGNYLEFFVSNHSLSDFTTSHFEVGYGLLSFLSKSISTEYSIFLMIFSGLTIFLKGIALKNWRYNQYYLISLLIFFSYYIGDIFPIRQSLALSIILFSGQFIIQRKLVPFLICVYLASLFHTSSLVFFLAYPISTLHFSTKTIAVSLLGSAVLGYVLTSIGAFEWLTQIPFLSGSAQDKLEAYTYMASTGKDTTGGSEFVDSTTSFITGLLRKIVLLFPLLIFRDKLSEKFSFFNVYFNLIIFGAIFYFIFGSLMQVLKRGASYYDIFEIMVIPMFIFISNNKWYRILIYCIIAAYSAAKLFMVLSYYKDLYIPFNTIFDKIHRFM
jgi:hypothetical protein